MPLNRASVRECLQNQGHMPEILKWPTVSAWLADVPARPRFFGLPRIVFLHGSTELRVDMRD